MKGFLATLILSLTFGSVIQLSSCEAATGSFGIRDTLPLKNSGYSLLISVYELHASHRKPGIYDINTKKIANSVSFVEKISFTSLVEVLFSRAEMFETQSQLFIPVQAEEQQAPIFKEVTPSRGYNLFLHSINDFYTNITAFFQSNFNLITLLRILVLIAVCCVVYAIYNRYRATSVHGEWILDSTVLEKQLVSLGASQESMEEFKQQFSKGVTAFKLSKRRLTIFNKEWSIDFVYEKISQDDNITTGLLDGKLVVMIWTPRFGPYRIISLRHANELEISSHLYKQLKNGAKSA